MGRLLPLLALLGLLLLPPPPLPPPASIHGPPPIPCAAAIGGIAGMVVIMLMPQVSTLVSHPCCRWCCCSTVCEALSLMMVWQCDFHLLFGSFNNSAAVDVWESVITIVVVSVVVVMVALLYQDFVADAVMQGTQYLE